MDIKITEAGIKDVAGIIEFEKKCFVCVTDRFSPKNITNQIKSATCRITIIKDKKGNILASATGFLRHFKVPSGRIYKIGVSPALKQKGIGSLLLQEMESWFLRNKMQFSFAEVRISNTPSRKMFIKSGYKEIGLLPCYYGNLDKGLDLEDGIKYKKKLSNEAKS